MICNMFENSSGGTTAVDVSDAFSRLLSSVSSNLIAGRTFCDKEIVGGANMTFKNLLEEITAVGAVTNVGDFIPWIDWLDIQGVKRRYRKVNALYDASMEKLIRDRPAKLSCACGVTKPMSFLDVLLSISQKDGSSFHDVQKIKALAWVLFFTSITHFL
eukprot:TRINITY_DN1528_c0_g1_i5.p2 TRINITY_DN1528_c0_g1~~TRINITY_DN1528_c0_g1_i5.p2  ORF type:complete len:159 (-),score=7.39 TRINITY_DN1528_c0_g1_i5:30-506(-)